MDEKIRDESPVSDRNGWRNGVKINLTGMRRWNQSNGGIFPPRSGERFERSSANEVGDFVSNSSVV